MQRVTGVYADSAVYKCTFYLFIYDVHGSDTYQKLISSQSSSKLLVHIGQVSHS